MKTSHLVSLLFVIQFAVTATCFAGTAVATNDSATSSLTPLQQRWLREANRHDREGWIYVRITGGAEERGFQHGYLLAKDIQSSLYAAKKGWEYGSGMDWSWLVEQGSKLFKSTIDSESLAEIDGIVEGMSAAGVKSSRAEIIAFNASIELEGYWWPKVKDSVGNNSPNRVLLGCSSFIATGSMTADGGIVLGHNTMTDYDPADCNIIFDIVPDKGHRILMQGTPGWIHSGTDFFITDAGLVGSETTISSFHGFDDSGIPEFVRMRRATQYAGTIDEWCDIMEKGNNGGYANAWLIGDVKTNEIARLELGLKHVVLERTHNGYYVGSNVAENVKILRLETGLHETDIRNSDVARRVRWHELMAKYKGKITAELGESFEADHFDTYLGTDRIGCRSLCGHWEYDTTDPAAPPFDPSGTVDGKVVDSKMAKQMSFLARWGAACGTAFDAAKFLKEHPQYDWMSDILRSRPSEPWTVFKAGE